MSTVKVECHGSKTKVFLNGRLKTKNMPKEKAMRFANSLGWKKPHKKGSTEPKKKDVKAAKKPAKKAPKKIK